MKNRQILVSLICATFIVTAGCASTAKTAATEPKTMVVREVRPDGITVLRTVTVDVPKARRKRPKWACKVGRLLHAGIAVYANPALAAVFIEDAVNRATYGGPK